MSLRSESLTHKWSRVVFCRELLAVLASWHTMPSKKIVCALVCATALLVRERVNETVRSSYSRRERASHVKMTG